MRRLKAYLGAFLLILGISASCNTKAAGRPLTVSGDPFVEPVYIRATCYTASPNAITASGSKVREGILAGKREWLGQVAMLYDSEMNFLGFYEFKDTGAGIDTDGDGKGDSLKYGLSIDIFQTDLESCYEWVNTYGDYVYMQIVPGVG